MQPCSQRECAAAAVREVRWVQPDDATQHPGMLIGAMLCEVHATKQEERLCQRNSCLRYAEVVIALEGEDYARDAPRRDELHACTGCWEAMKAAPSVVLNGIRMVHDGSGRMKALPANLGRG